MYAKFIIEATIKCMTSAKKKRRRNVRYNSGKVLMLKQISDRVTERYTAVN